MTTDVRRDVVYRLRSRIEDFQAEQKLVDALTRLPNEPRDFALDQCFFVAVGGDQGGFYVSQPALFGAGDDFRWLVVLNSGWSVDDFQSAAAHEIAHLWLGHPEVDLIGTEVERHENEAAALVREWGFTGIGALPWNERPGV